MNETDLRVIALGHAINHTPSLKPSDVISAAEAYLAFLKARAPSPGQQVGKAA